MSSTSTRRAPPHSHDVFQPDFAASAIEIRPPTSTIASGRSPAITTTTVGDHGLVYDLLVVAGKSPSREAFHATLDNPLYSPTDRLVVRAAGRIAAHGLVLRRTMELGDVQIPIGDLHHLAVAPEFAGRGWVSDLLAAAQFRMWNDGAVLATTWSNQRDELAAAGWQRLAQQGFSRASARDILAHWIRQAEMQPRRRRIIARAWRRVEIRSLVDVYRQATARRNGPLARDEAYWQWLVSRRAFEHIIVAIDGPDSLELGAAGPKIVGYAALSGPHIVELLVSPGFEHAAPVLLAEACREAIERGHSTVCLQTPPADVLHEIVITAGGEWRPRDPGEHGLWWKVIDARDLVRRLSDVLIARAKHAGLARPFKLGFRVHREHLELLVSRRAVRLAVVDNIRGRCDLKCNLTDFQRLLVGQLDLAQANDRGEASVKSRSSLAALVALFPRRPLARPLLDDLST